MTGGGEGFCILKLTDDPLGTPADSVGRLGRPVGEGSGKELALARLQQDVRQMESALNAIRARLEQLDAARAQHSGAGR